MKKTAKQLYDEEMERINDYNISQFISKEEDRELEKESEEIMKQVEEKEVVDKSMGEEKIVVTKEQHEFNKAKQINAAAVQNLNKINAMRRKPHLTTEQLKQMQSVLIQFKDEKLENPVLKHLVKRKIELTEEFLKSEVKAKEIYQNMLIQVNKVSEQIVKVRGIIEQTDKEILELFKESL